MTDDEKLSKLNMVVDSLMPAEWQGVFRVAKPDLAAAAQALRALPLDFTNAWCCDCGQKVIDCSCVFSTEKTRALRAGSTETL